MCVCVCMYVYMHVCLCVYDIPIYQSRRRFNVPEKNQGVLCMCVYVFVVGGNFVCIGVYCFVCAFAYVCLGAYLRVRVCV